jgi:hypothetical protein
VLIVKIMSGENLEDNHSEKDYMLIQVGDRDRIQFGYMDKTEARADLTLDNLNRVCIMRDGMDSFEMYEMTGNVYIMNQNGKTIDSRSPATNNKDFGKFGT